MPVFNHQYYMQIALQEAQKAAEKGEIPVGAVLVYQGEVIAKEHNRREELLDATCHAEMEVIRLGCRILQNWRLMDCTLYVTLEPCPMCAGAIVNARIPYLVYGTADIQGGGCESIFNIPLHPSLNHQVQIIGGVCEKECQKILRKFFQQKRNCLR